MRDKASPPSRTVARYWPGGPAGSPGSGRLSSRRRLAGGPDVTFVAGAGAVRGVLIVADAVKPTSAEAVARLRAMGLHPVLLTGDNERAARAVAASAGIDDVIAGVRP